MEDIKDFKQLHYYGNGGKELTREEIKKIGLEPKPYLSLDECAYQAAYDLSNDWAKDNPDWGDVKEAYRRGANDGIKYAERVFTDLFKKLTKGTGLFKDDNIAGGF